MKRLLGIVFVVSVVFGMVAGPAFANENSSDAQSLVAKIEALQKQIEALKARLSGNAGNAGGASSSSSGSATVTGTVVPWMPPVFDDDRSDDEIVQLNNLRIESVAADPATAGISIISASADVGVGCRKFMSLESSAGAAIACPMAPTRLYQIRVDGETRLFLRDRTKASIGDFEPGNRINAYGFMDSANYGVQALIVRNLDKPVVRTFVQLNNLVVLSVPSDKSLPFVFTAGQKGSSPCFDFGEKGERGVSAPCPLSIEAPQSSSGSSAAGGMAVPELYQVSASYEIAVESRTYVIDRERHDLGVGGLAVGDKVNVYGVTGGSRGRVNAMIVRDLSKPATKPAEKSVLRVNVVDPSIMCTMIWQGPDSAPCGGVDGAVVSLFREDGSLLEAQKAAQGVATFRGLAEGAYIVSASKDGYAPAKQYVKFAGTADERITLTLSKPATAQ